METTGASAAQVNTRINSAVKHKAESVLDMAGSSATELVRAVFDKVARGTRDFEELSAVLSAQSSPLDARALERGWAIADSLYANKIPSRLAKSGDSRSWDEVYAEARQEHFTHKEL